MPLQVVPCERCGRRLSLARVSEYAASGQAVGLMCDLCAGTGSGRAVLRSGARRAATLEEGSPPSPPAPARARARGNQAVLRSGARRAAILGAGAPLPPPPPPPPGAGGRSPVGAGGRPGRSPRVVPDAAGRARRRPSWAGDRGRAAKGASAVQSAAHARVRQGAAIRRKPRPRGGPRRARKLPVLGLVLGGVVVAGGVVASLWVASDGAFSTPEVATEMARTPSPASDADVARAAKEPAKSRRRRLAAREDPEERAAFAVALLRTEVEALLSRGAAAEAAAALQSFPDGHRGSQAWEDQGLELASRVADALAAAAERGADPVSEDDRSTRQPRSPTGPVEAEVLRPPTADWSQGGFAGAVRVREQLGRLDFEALEAEVLVGLLKLEVVARLAALDALSRAVLDAVRPPRLVVRPGGVIEEVRGADRGGLRVAAGRVPWREVSARAMAELFDWADLSSAAPLGHALVCDDLGLRRRADEALEQLGLDEVALQGVLQRLRGDAYGDGVGRRDGLLVAAETAGRLEEGEVRWRGEWLDPVAVDSWKTALRPDRRLRRERSRQAKEDAREEFKDRYERLGVYEVTTTVNSGDSAKRVDVVFVSDGFSYAEREQYQGLVDRTARALLRLDPYRNYVRYINVHRVGIDDTAKSGSGSTRVRSSASADRGSILTCDRSAARRYGQLAPDADLIIVVCNIRGVRATGGGGVITIDGSGDIGDVVIHELGHAFGGLDDEYVNEADVASFPDWSGAAAEAGHVNTTRVSDVAKVKWHYWRLPPTPTQAVGVYEGGYYRARGYYRPSGDCRMRSSDFSRYCPVCLEHLERKFYQLLAPIDEAEPRRIQHGVFADESFDAGAAAIQIIGTNLQGGFSALWYVDGESADSSWSSAREGAVHLSVPARKLTPGWHEVALKVALTDSRIRRDWGSLSSSRAWRVRVYSTRRPELELPRRVKAVLGEPVEIPVVVSGEVPPGFVLEPSLLPPGARFIPSERAGETGGVVRWTPDVLQRGAWRVEMRLGDGLRDLAGGVDIDVERGGRRGRNVAPLLSRNASVSAREGEALEVDFACFDPDGDQLRFQVEGLPDTAVFDVSRGRLSWVPERGDSAKRRSLRLTVTDGRARDEAIVELQVEGSSRQRLSGLAGFDIIYGLRARGGSVRRAALGELLGQEQALSFVVLQAVRLLRDPDAAVSATALELLRRVGGERPETGPGALVPIAPIDVRGMILEGLATQMWQFVDAPEILTWAERLAERSRGGDLDKVSRLVLKQAGAMRIYNRRRGVVR